MIEAHPFIFGALIVVSWSLLYRAGFNDAMFITRKKFQRGEIMLVPRGSAITMPRPDVCEGCGRRNHEGICKP